MFKGYFRVFLILFPLVFSSVTSPFAQTSNTITNNIERAQTLLNDVYAELNYNNTVGDLKMYIHGTYMHDAMTEQMGAAREFLMSGVITFSHGGEQLLRKDTFSRIGENTITSFYDINDEHINVTEANEVLKLSDKDREAYLYQSLIFSPNLLLQVVLKDASRNSFIASEDKYHIIRHNNRAGNAYFLYINSKTYYLEKIEQPMYDPVSGDYFRTITYSNYDVQDGYQAPGKIVISRDSTVLYNLSVDIREILPRVDYGTMRLSQKDIGEWLYLVPMAKWNCKTVIADMKDFLVVFEPPGTNEAGYTLIDNIKRAYPGKEIKYCVVSHQHPEHIGGIRPFMEDGAIIVTTEANRSYFQGIARNRHLFSPDVRVKKYITPKFLFVTLNKQEIKAGERVIQLFLLNKKSYHTDDYIISYIPSEKLLIEGDLIKTWNLKERALDKKERGLVEFIDDMKINVKQVVQTWPLENSPHVFDYDLIKPESNNKLLKGTKKVLDAFN
ncbi:MAG: hypothetical protein H6550_02900 [Chitinophagales bacterium]|nr:hypothetical protein [Chitinophagales bacterium]